MTMDKKEFEKLAALSGLRFSETETEECMRELEALTKWTGLVNSAVEGNAGDIKNVNAREIDCEQLRDDILLPSLDRNKLLSGAENERGCFAVKKVIE